ncbi:MAG: YtxH domain-containing protein [Bacteroidetes bacterium]|nr:YtxH domain-containing protein [Bacteroidota bacterium]
MKKSSMFITGLLVGTAAGAVLGLLFAPEEGSKTREMLRMKLEELKRKKKNLEKAISDLHEEISGLGDEDEDFDEKENPAAT